MSEKCKDVCSKYPDCLIPPIVDLNPDFSGDLIICNHVKRHNQKEYDFNSFNHKVPIDQWGDESGLKKQLETHRDYGDDFVRLALITFREYLRDNADMMKEGKD